MVAAEFGTDLTDAVHDENLRRLHITRPLAKDLRNTPPSPKRDLTLPVIFFLRVIGNVLFMFLFHIRPFLGPVLPS